MAPTWSDVTPTMIVWSPSWSKNCFSQPSVSEGFWAVEAAVVQPSPVELAVVLLGLGCAGDGELLSLPSCGSQNPIVIVSPTAVACAVWLISTVIDAVGVPPVIVTV